MMIIRPLLATGKRLFAQAAVKGKANEVRVLVFDTTQKGKCVLQSDPIALAPWVAVGPAHGRSFASAARLDKGGLLYHWQARAWYAGGARPTPEIEQAARKEASGVALVKLETGKVVPLAAKGKGTVFSPDGPGTAKLGGRTFTLLDQAVPGKTFQRRRLLRATDAAGAELWQHEIAAPVFLPPLP
jgi:hypothetical protein